ncbi:hypothetical protein V1478_017934 [Vespula squamosa]|uniref:Uncharacterized protein n=1 Tax=Vespula squamosa TaxID=30214 RepID=A0ABD1ZVM2_VESSQ
MKSCSSKLMYYTLFSRYSCILTKLFGYMLNAVVYAFALHIVQMLSDTCKKINVYMDRSALLCTCQKFESNE